MKNVQLFIIDNQNDFCDPKGALYVPGADTNSQNLAEMIKRNIRTISDIRITMDSHHKVHISHPIFWVDKDGKNPDPFTIITPEDVNGANPKWKSTNPGFQDWSVKYINELASQGKYPHCIWPEHCLIGSWGHNIHPVLFEALLEWEKTFATVDMTTKGSNIFVEAFSIFKSEISRPDDPTTALNTELIKRLQTADVIGIGGQALSHCVANSVRDLADNFGDENLSKLVLLEDATSPVPGFENLADDFMKEMTARGMRVSNTKDFLA